MTEQVTETVTKPSISFTHSCGEVITGKDATEFADNFQKHNRDKHPGEENEVQ